MLQRPTTRTAIKQYGAAAVVVLAVAWVASGWWAVQWADADGLTLGVGAGCVFVLVEGGPPFLQSRLGFGNRCRSVADWRVRWKPHVSLPRMGREYFLVNVPLWIIALPILLATADAWRLDTLARCRARNGGCPACGYDLAGIGAGMACPECGGGASSLPLPTPAPG